MRGNAIIINQQPVFYQCKLIVTLNPSWLIILRWCGFSFRDKHQNATEKHLYRMWTSSRKKGFWPSLSKRRMLNMWDQRPSRVFSSFFVKELVSWTTGFSRSEAGNPWAQDTRFLRTISYDNPTLAKQKCWISVDTCINLNYNTRGHSFKWD